MKARNIILFLIFALIVGGIGGVLLNRFGIPYLSNLPGFGWVKKLESTTPVIINRHDEVQFSEGVDLVNLSKQAGSFVAGIYAQNQNTLKYLENGIVVSSDGMIVTSKIPIANNANLVVVTNDGSNYPAQIRALDPRSELAVLTINASNLSFAQFNDSANLTPTSRVMYVGESNKEFLHNYLLAQVSGNSDNNQSLERIFYSEAFEENFTTDALPNASFIGGPIVSLDGKVVGMLESNMQILISEDLQTAVTSFLSRGKIQRPSLGIKYLKLSSQLAKLRNLPAAGDLVTSVDPGSPAQIAGIAPNDFITNFDSKDLGSNSLEKLLNAHDFTDVGLNFLRNGDEQTVTVKLNPK